MAAAAVAIAAAPARCQPGIEMRAEQIRHGLAAIQADPERVKGELDGLVRVKLDLAPGLLLRGEELTLTIQARADRSPNPKLEVLEGCYRQKPQVHRFLLRWRPNEAIALGEKFGRLMNYGDGLYGGQFVGGMYAEAFLEKDPVKIVEAGLRCLPPGSQYAEAIRDVLRWHRENPRDWQKTWALVNRKYQENPAYRRASCEKGAFDIDAKLNGAYVALGLLYGERDPEKTITIAARCGQDSDCNPSTAAGVLFTTIGFSNLPGRFTAELNQDTLFSHTAYNFAGVVEVCEQLARQVVARSAGKIAQDANGDDVFVIPVRAPKSSPLEQSWAPGPPAPGGR